MLIPTKGSVRPSTIEMIGLYFVFAIGGVVTISLICERSAFNHAHKAAKRWPPVFAEPNFSMIETIEGGIINGICDMFSVPPTNNVSIVPDLIFSKPIEILSKADAQFL